MRRTLIIFGTLIILVLALLRFGYFQIISGAVMWENAIALIAVAFMVIGIILGRLALEQPEGEGSSIEVINPNDFQLSTREYQVLLEIEKGLSNKEIARKLHITESTVKTHVSNLLFKLGAKRRTQAIKNAQKMGLIS